MLIAQLLWDCADGMQSHGSCVMMGIVSARCNIRLQATGGLETHTGCTMAVQMEEGFIKGFAILKLYKEDTYLKDPAKRQIRSSLDY